MQSIRFVHNEENNNLIPEVQPHVHKVLKKSIKITLKSATKQKSQNQSLDKFITLPTHRLSKSIVQSGEQKKYSKLKNDIDGRLNRVYSIMTKHSQIKLGESARYNQKIRNKSKLVLESKTKVDPFQIINQKNPQLYKQLPYELVKKYIESIYQQYQIKDPLQNGSQNSNYKLNLSTDYRFKQTPTKTLRLNDYRTSTKKKILLLKDNFISQLNQNTKKKQKYALQTPRKFITQSALNRQHSKSLSKGIGLSTKKKLQNTLKQFQNNLNQQSIMMDNKISRFQGQQKYSSTFINVEKMSHTLAQTKLTSSQVNNSYFPLYNSSNNLKLNDTLNNSCHQKATQNKKIKQIFRYCFVCQQAILQSNMAYHQTQCQGLNRILSDPNLTFQKMHQLIDQKLIKIQKQLQQILLKNEQKDTSSKLTQIKQNVMKWIQSINSQIKDKIEPQKRKSVAQYAKINQAIKSTNILKSFQLINKLNWFLHLKINFDKEINKVK